MRRTPRLEHRTFRTSFAIFAGVTLAFLVVEVLSQADEGAALARALALEATSVSVILALFAPVALVERRAPPLVERWPVAVPLHLAASLVFSAVHVGAMMGLRFALWPVLFAEPYSAFDEPFADALYEYRKDVLTYALMLGVILLVREREIARERLDAARTDARTDRTILLRCGGRQIHLPAEEIVSASAAGNYVEVRTAAGAHLARITLSGLEALMNEAGAEPVRLHRSHLAARKALREITPVGDGDAEARLCDGSRLPVSRRHRPALTRARPR